MIHKLVASVRAQSVSFRSLKSARPLESPRGCQSSRSSASKSSHILATSHQLCDRSYGMHPFCLQLKFQPTQKDTLQLPETSSGRWNTSSRKYQGRVLDDKQSHVLLDLVRVIIVGLTCMQLVGHLSSPSSTSRLLLYAKQSGANNLCTSELSHYEAP
jgi:hypothetical protein